DRAKRAFEEGSSYRFDDESVAGGSVRSPMVLGSQLILVADDRHLAHSIRDRIRAELCQPPLLSPFHAAHDYIGPSFSGPVVCAACSAEDVDQTARLVREIRLRQWPATVLLVEAGPMAGNPVLASLDPYIACRLHWPDQAGTLLGVIQFNAPDNPPPFLPNACGVRPGGGSTGTQSDLADVLVRQLLRHTPSLTSLAESLALAATHDVTVLLTGETGTGKT